MVGARIYREKGLSGWLGRVFLDKRLALLAVVRISPEKGWSGSPGGVFLEKKAGLDGLGAYFFRENQ